MHSFMCSFLYSCIGIVRFVYSLVAAVVVYSFGVSAGTRVNSLLTYPPDSSPPAATWAVYQTSPALSHRRSAG